MTPQVLSAVDDRLAPRLGLVLAGLILLYLVALDQGALLSLVQGAAAFDQNMLHELVHDARHLTALPCH
jgi:hypothetical protein